MLTAAEGNTDALGSQRRMGKDSGQSRGGVELVEGAREAQFFLALGWGWRPIPSG